MFRCLKWAMAHRYLTLYLIAALLIAGALPTFHPWQRVSADNR